ncbi:hypothetical protein FJY69_05680 [candidate division WOR-3 bacterium]|nr:hypothetical protein [candidate division WOR-3 bacterium]
MTSAVEKLVGEVKSLSGAELEELLTWLADFEAERMDAWDQQVAADSRPGGRLRGLIDRAEQDIASGRTRPVDEVIGD